MGLTVVGKLAATVITSSPGRIGSSSLGLVKAAIDYKKEKKKVARKRKAAAAKRKK